jgi:hypothetical protein
MLDYPILIIDSQLPIKHGRFDEQWGQLIGQYGQKNGQKLLK